MDRYEAGKVKPVEASAKLDGVYARATRDGVFTKSGKKVPSPHIEKRLRRYFKKHPAGALEGELWRKKAGIEAIAGEARSGNTGKLKLHVYPGQASPPLPFGAVRRVKGYGVKDDAGVEKVYRRALRKGHEGVVVRGEDGRKFKKKPEQDAEFPVDGVRAGKKAVLTMRTAEGRPFKVQAGGGAAAAKAGDQVQVRYSGLTRSGKPKAAVAVRVRNEKDFSMKTRDEEQIRKDRKALLKGAILTAAGAAGMYAMLRKPKVPQPKWKIERPGLPSPAPSRMDVAQMRQASGRVIESGRTIPLGPKVKTPKAKAPTMTQAAAANNERKGGVKRLVRAAELRKQRAWGALKTPSAKRLAKLHPSVQQEYLRLDKAARSKGIQPLPQHADQVTAREARIAERTARELNRRKLQAYREKKNFQTAFTMKYLSDEGPSRSEKLKNAVLAGGAATSAGAAIYSARQIGKAQKTVQVLAPQLTPREIARAVGQEVSGKAKRTLKGYFPTFIKGGKKVSALLKKKMFEEKPLTHEELVMRYGQKQAKRIIAAQEKKRGWLFATPASRLLNFGNAEQWREIDSRRYGNPLKAAAGLEKGYFRTKDGNPVLEDIPLAHAQVLKSTYNKAHKIQKKVSRAGALGKDVVNVARGKPRDRDQAGREKKREWEKPWFKTAARNAAIAGGMIYGAKRLRDNPMEREWVRRKINQGARKVNKVVPDMMKEWGEKHEARSMKSETEEKNFATPASRILGKFEKPLRKGALGKFMGPSAAQKAAAADRAALVGRLKAAAAKGNDKAAGMVNRAQKHAAMKEAGVKAAERRQKDAVRTLKKGAGIAAGGAVLGGTAMKLHADQPEDRKVNQGARFRNALMGAAAGSFLGGALHAGKSGFRGARLGAAAGGLIGAVSNPKRKQVIEELPVASFETPASRLIEFGKVAYRGISVKRYPGQKVRPGAARGTWSSYVADTWGVPAKHSAEAVEAARKIRIFKKNPVGKEIEGTRKALTKDPEMGRWVKNKSTPALVVEGRYGKEIYKKGSRETKDEINRLNIGRARGKNVKVSKGWIGAPYVQTDFKTRASALFHFDEIAADAGWDIRDPRGKSARVFAPGSRQRYRRPKEWHEKKENRDKLAAAAVLAAGIGGFALGRKLKGRKKIPVPSPAPGGSYHYAPRGPRSTPMREAFRHGPKDRPHWNN
jgi:hypothetical protein